jgi:hypothetical protein
MELLDGPAGSQPAIGVQYDIVVVAGQSNASGYGLAIDATAFDTPHPRVYQYATASTYAGKIIAGSDPLAHPDRGAPPALPFGVGPGMSFARWYADTLPPGRRVLVVPVGWQGTAFSDTAVVGGGVWDVARSGEANNRYDFAVAQANAAVTAAGTGAKVVAFIWVQGESDAINAVPAATYEAKLDQLIDAFRTNITTATATTPFLVGSMVPEWVAGPGGSTAQAINGVHQATPTRVGYTAVAAGTTGASQDTGGIHYNAVGQRSQGARLFQALATARSNALAPTAPAMVTTLIGETDSGQVALTWSKPGSHGSPVTGYSVRHRTTAGPGAWTTVATGTTALTRTITGLTNGTSYDFQVAATNGVGTGPYSATLTTVAQVPTVPAAPTALAMVTAYDVAADLSWTAGANGGRVITDYVLQWSPAGANTWTTATDGVSATTVGTISSLTVATSYDFRVAAVNSVGQGPYSTVLTASTKAYFVNDTFTGTNATLLESHTGEIGATWTKGFFTSGTASLNASNQLNLTGTNVVGSNYVASGTPGSADYSVSADFKWSTNGVAGLTIRGDTALKSWFGFTAVGNTQFAIYIDATTLLSAVTVSGNIGTTETYKLTLAASGTTISGRVQRASDSFYLSNTGTWQAGAAFCCSGTSSAHNGAGKAGLIVTTPAVAVVDNFRAL